MSTDTEEVQRTPVRKPGTRSRTKPEWEERADYCCAMCLHRITSSQHAIAKQGNHYHDCVNPDGRRFLIVCFSRAQGCSCSGELTGHFSWFNHYRWQFAHCRSCGSQLGWRYDGSDSFFGLILEQLVECPPD